MEYDGCVDKRSALRGHGLSSNRPQPSHRTLNSVVFHQYTSEPNLSLYQYSATSPQPAKTDNADDESETEPQSYADTGSIYTFDDETIPTNFIETNKILLEDLPEFLESSERQEGAQVALWENLDKEQLLLMMEALIAQAAVSGSQETPADDINVKPSASPSNSSPVTTRNDQNLEIDDNFGVIIPPWAPKSTKSASSKAEKQRQSDTARTENLARVQDLISRWDKINETNRSLNSSATPKAKTNLKTKQEQPEDKSKKNFFPVAALFAKKKPMNDSSSVTRTSSTSRLDLPTVLEMPAASSGFFKQIEERKKKDSVGGNKSRRWMFWNRDAKANHR